MKMCFCPQWPWRKLLLTKCSVKCLKWDEVAWTRQQPGVAASTWTVNVLQPKPSLGRLGPTFQAMSGITLTSKDARNWDFGEMTSAPTILGPSEAGKCQREKHVVISGCRVDAWLDTVAVPWGLPSSQLAVLSTVLLACLNLCLRAFLVHHMPPLRDNFCALFRAFTVLQLKLYVCKDEKNPNWMRSFFSSHLRHSAC